MILPVASVIILARLVVGQLPSPCPDVFSYEERKEQDRWYGVISLQSTDELRGVWVHITLDQPAELLGNWFGDATSTDNQEFTIKHPKYRLQAGAPVSLRFFVKYNAASVVPSLSAIRLNGKTVCLNDKPSETTTTTLHLSSQIRTTTTTTTTTKRPHTDSGSEAVLTAGRRRPGVVTKIGDQRDQIATAPPIRRVTSTTPRWQFFPGDLQLQAGPKPAIPQAPTASRRQYACGTIAIKAAPLISHGQKSEKGQWPWHVALYHSQAGLQLIYICGGTLISEYHVVTAAHCVSVPKSNQTVDPENIIVYLGKYNLKTFGQDVQDREITNIIVHPQYNPNVYFNDIAILKMGKSVDFNNYIRPCCLWEDDTESDLLENKLGTVVGWGFNENRQLSTFLMQAQMPVISTIKCIYSNRDFFSQFTFEKTFCAGYRNGTSVCNGDSGGGMVFPKSGTSGQDTVWQLRGLVSVSVALQNEGVCDPTHYTVFTDVAKHVDWIRDTIKQ